MKAIVIYYSGDEYRAVEVETDIVDSAMAHVYGLPDDYDVIAVIANPGTKYDVYIEEVVQISGRGSDGT